MSQKSSINHHPSISAPQAIIMAAGKGTRMGSDPANARAKVLYEIADRPMVQWVVDACLAAGVSRIIVVVGYQADAVRASLAGFSQCAFVEQREQLGTGHATRMAEPLFQTSSPTDVFVLAGDGPLIRADTLKRLLAVHRDRRAAATLATSVLDDPSGYGRVVRASDGSFDCIIEQKDATPEQARIREVNPSYYCFRSDLLFGALSRVRNDSNKQGEYYLTDVPAILKSEGHKIALIDAVPPEDVLSINTPVQLAEVNRIMRERLALPIDTGQARRPRPANA